MPGARQRASTTMAESAPKSLLIEGWRASNHSFALVNQYQMLELTRLHGLRLFHRDAPFHLHEWKRSVETSGFSPADRLVLDSVKDAGEEKVDCVYRIFSPFRANAADDRRRTVYFMVTEMGPFTRMFAPGSGHPEDFTRDDNRVVTPTHWSRARLIEWGIAADRISVVPHGIDSNHFRPLTVAERQAGRKILGVDDDEIVFLNVGAAIWHKGVDILLVAFAYLRDAGRRVRLVLRDRIDMYGCSLSNDMRTLAKLNPGLFTAETMAAIIVIQDDLAQDHLRLLYGAVDCYVSPYRAEGFNLPVLEAIACGTPVIVTRDGATDDFCNDQVAVRIPGTTSRFEKPENGHSGRYIELKVNDVTEAMDCFATRQNVGLDRSGVARDRVVSSFSWRNAAVQLGRATVGYVDNS